MPLPTGRMTLFIAELAFGSPRDVEVAKLAVLLASLLASVFGAVILRSANRPAARTSRRHSRT